MRTHTADYFSGWETAPKATENQRSGRLPLSRLLFLAISLPFLHSTGPSYQNKIVISTAEASPFYWRLSDVRVIMSDLGFDRPTREKLVLQGESMALGHIPINRLPQLFLLTLPALWQIRCFIRGKNKGRMKGGWGFEWQHRSMLKITRILIKHLITMFELHYYNIQANTGKKAWSSTVNVLL